VHEQGHAKKARMLVILMQVSHVRFEVLTPLMPKTRVFWDVINSQCFKES